jgi:response regulator RpfG family c-di-GMP phosphodiesterase
MSEARRIGKFEIRDLLGKGAASAVYRGSDGDKMVALKLMNRATVGAAALARLQQSATALARVRHPAIATFIETIEADKFLCIVSELAEGESLAARMTDDTPHDLKQTWDVARQVLEGLESAHAKGVFHGSLKLANLVVDKQMRVKVTDLAAWGLGEITPNAYTAPELLGGDAPNARSDLYQVGAIVYHLVAGRPPFSGARDEIAHRVRQERPSDPSSYSPKVAWQLDWVIQRALSKEPMDRFGSAREFLDGLRLGLQDSIGSPLPVPAPPPAAEAKPAAPVRAAVPIAPAKAAAPAAPAKAAAPAEPAKTAAPAEPAKTAAPAAPAMTAAHVAPAAPVKVVSTFTPAKPAAPAAPTKVVSTFTPAKPGAPSAPTRAAAPIAPAQTAASAAPALAAAPVAPAKAAPVATAETAESAATVPAAEVDAPAQPAAPEVKRAGSGLVENARLIAPAPADETHADGADGADGRLGLLFVDDEERVLNALRSLFRNEYQVYTAASGEEALALVKRHAIPIIVSDQRMPGMNGVELLRQLRAEQPQTVRMLLTGYSDLAALVGSINEGEVFRFIRKPWDNDEIRATVSEAATAAMKLAQRAAPQSAVSPRTAGSLLVIDPGKGLAEGLERLVAGEAKVTLVGTVPEAAKLLQSNEYAAIVADLRAGKDDLVKLFRVVKAKRPETLSILVAAEADSELVADLINQAQIYRFLAKPINGRELHAHVGEALRRYAEFKQSGKKKDLGLAEDVGAAAAGRLVSHTA